MKREEMGAVFEQVDIGFLFINNDFILKEMNQVAESAIGLVQTCIEKNVMDFAQFEYLYQGMKAVQYTKENYKKQIQGKENKSWLMTIVPYIVENKFEGGFVTLKDMTESVELETKLHWEKKRYQILAEITECGLWEYDPFTKEMIQFKTLKERELNSNLNIPCYRNQMLEWNVIHPDDIDEFHQYCNSMDCGEEYFQYDIRVLNNKKEYMWFRYEGRSVQDDEGNIKKVLGKTQNIDIEKKRLENLIELTEKDPLTGVYNKMASKRRIEMALKDADWKEKGAIYIIDIDDFKDINDMCGHLYGDVVLENFARRIKAEFAANSIIGRIGGDEFVIFISNIKELEELDYYARKIQSISQKQSKVSKPTLNHIEKCSVSIGIAISPKDGINYEELFEKADSALYYVKENGKAGYEVYRNDMEYEKIRKFTGKRKEKKKDLIQSMLVSSPFVEKRIANFALEMINNAQNTESVIPVIFSEIGKYYNLGRIYIVQNNVWNDKCQVNYEWCNETVKEQKEKIEEMVRPDWNQYLSYFNSNGNFVIEEIEKTTEIDICEKQKKFYQKAEVKANLQCVLYNKEEFYGIVNFDKCDEIQSWSKLEITTLTAITKIIGVYLFQLEDKIALEDKIFYTKEIIKNQKLSNYIVEKGTYKLLYVGEYTDKKFPNVVIGKPCYQTLYKRDSPCDICPIQYIDEKEKNYAVESFDKKSGVWSSTNVTAIYDKTRGDMYVICQSDVTSFLSRIKSKDELTGIYTGQKFRMEAVRILEQSKQIYAIICTDISEFKCINNEWGYTVGDFVLKVYAQIILEETKEDELCCRVTADKFRLLWKFETEKQLRERLEKVWEKVDCCIHNMYPKLNLVYVNGVYVVDMEEKVLSNSIDKANIARKKKKGLSKSSILFYDKELHNQLQKEKEIERKMITAIQEREFVVYYQPKVDLKTKKIVSAEALIRWIKPDGSVILPSEFIPIFERNGFIEEMDFFVCQEVFRKIKKWQLEGKPPIVISINISRVYILNSNFVERLSSLAETYQIPTNLIELELTETILLNDIERLIFVIQQLREKGFLISIDDFGSGYSSLNILNKLSIDILKLDKEFFLQNNLAEKDKVIILSILKLAQVLGIKVVSEGVETKEQVEFLTENQCDMAQGYFFYRPVSEEVFETLL